MLAVTVALVAAILENWQNVRGVERQFVGIGITMVGGVRGSGSAFHRVITIRPSSARRAAVPCFQDWLQDIVLAPHHVATKVSDPADQQRGCQQDAARDRGDLRRIHRVTSRTNGHPRDSNENNRAGNT